MATRSAIGVMHGDICKAVYCHWDGYLEHNGKILQEHYLNSAKLNLLVSLGDISVLSETIGEKHDFDDRSRSTWTKFYGRDRGEEGTDFRTFNSYYAFMDHFKGMSCEFFYIMKDGVWYYSTVDLPALKPLAPALEAIVEGDMA
jgi:hypothetical protein